MQRQRRSKRAANSLYEIAGMGEITSFPEKARTHARVEMHPWHQSPLSLTEVDNVLFT
jgi:hypothetical protein